MSQFEELTEMMEFWIHAKVLKKSSLKLEGAEIIITHMMMIGYTYLTKSCVG